MSGFRIEGDLSGNVGEVTSNKEQLVALGLTQATMGGALIFSQNDAGERLGTPDILSPETTEDYRLRVGIDTPLLGDTFNYAAQNTSLWSYTTTTMTMVHASGFVVLNAGNSVATTVGAWLKSWRTFTLWGASALYFEESVALLLAPVANNVIEIGAFLAPSATADITDGVYFQYDGVSNLRAVLNYNGTVTQSVPIIDPTAGDVHKYTITLTNGAVEFWIDDVLAAEIPTPPGVGQPMSSGSLPACVRTRNRAATALAQQVKVSNVTVSLADWNTSKPWEDVCAGAGLFAAQGVAGMTQGSTSNNVNNTAPTSIALANAGPGYTTLGGQFQFAAILGAATDYVLFGFQNPVGATGLTGRTLYIKGVYIDTMNTGAAVAGTPTVLIWTLGVGATQVSLATAADTATAKAARRTSLGIQSFPIGAAIGAQAASIIAPIGTQTVAQGEFVHIILNMPLNLAFNTGGQILRGTVRIVGYWE